MKVKGPSPKEDREWEIESDVNAILRYHSLMENRRRFKRAQKRLSGAARMHGRNGGRSNSR